MMQNQKLKNLNLEERDFEQNQLQDNDNNLNPNQNINKGVHTSVKVSNRPGGQSNIVFGTDDTNYDHYRK